MKRLGSLLPKSEERNDMGGVYRKFGRCEKSMDTHERHAKCQCGNMGTNTWPEIFLTRMSVAISRKTAVDAPKTKPTTTEIAMSIPLFFPLWRLAARFQEKAVTNQLIRPAQGGVNHARIKENRTKESTLAAQAIASESRRKMPTTTKGGIQKVVVSIGGSNRGLGRVANGCC